MTINIMNEYIELTKKQISEYLKIVFVDRFNQRYCDIFTEKYVNIRYFNYYENDIYESTRRKIIDHLKQTGEDIIINYIDDRELIELMRMFFYYVLYFDNVVYCKDLRKKIEQIDKLRQKKIGNEYYNFQENLYQKINEYAYQKEELMKQFGSNDFFIKLTRYPNKSHVYRVNLKFDIKFPLEYSEYAINKAFQMGIVNEDKLVVEYYLIVLQILKDVLKQNFKRKYIVEFAHTLFKKPKKIKGILNMIDNPVIQEKISLKIKYEQFLDNKETIYDLMREGYKFTVVLDNSFEASFKEIESLQMFDFVILNSSLETYNEVVKYKEELRNIIEI